MAEVAPAQSGSFNDFGMEGLADLCPLRDLHGVLKDGDGNEMIAFAQLEHHRAEQETEEAITKGNMQPYVEVLKGQVWHF